ncbi:hypothetical protein [Streptomyces cellulosae]|uniref:hypothetical protein n=1 Tax=Streptomyces cellulosae TaxID=1968 RepID=UPI0004C73425|nr:hypothetical protein [Streptomyces cellulosae]
MQQRADALRDLADRLATRAAELHTAVGDSIDDTLPVGRLAHIAGEGELGQGPVAVGLGEFALPPQSRPAAAGSGVDSATVTSGPRSEATAVMPEPMSPQVFIESTLESGSV